MIYNAETEAAALQQQKLFIDAKRSLGADLRFEASLERAFVDAHSQQHSSVRIFGLLFLALFALPSTVFEAMAGSAPEFAAHALPYQLLLIVLPCCTAAALAFARYSGLMVRMSCYFAVLVSSIGWVVLSHIGQQHHIEISYLYPSGTLLLSSGLLHVATRPHLVVALFVSAVQLNVTSLNASAGYSAVSILVLCVALNLVSCVIAWYNELADKRAWLNIRVLQQKIYIDELTQLLNRRGFWHHFSRLSRQAGRVGSPLSLMVISIDGFSAFQQKHGYAAADSALIKVANLLVPQARRPFDIVGRLDAGTYAVCWYQSDAEFVHHTAEIIIQAVSELDLRKNANSTKTLSITASAGCLVNTMPTTSEEMTAEEFIEAAGKLLQQAQNSGGNTVAFAGS